MKTILKSPVTPPLRPLGVDGLALWDRVQAQYAISDAGGTELLQLAAEATDRLTALRSAPEVDARIEMSVMAFISRTLQKLGLNLEPIKAVGRPGIPTSIGWQR